ncbi:ABC transporter permease [Chryseolinea sp. Jin1]|uniref:ABC transporter permease n=2 Tax=Chryseolinea lacunae TaxID=2801331 RepID=A0ABS1KT57_9BACT|nr:ABC transporter permease [Chryseolinea lacunae]MBL0741471.1 ABC transporter permease [Chryseolinea lacunae]
MTHKPHQQNPPTWAIRFFQWFCNDHLADAALGDMLELYDRRRARLGKRKADLLFICNVLFFLQPFAIRRRSESTSHHTLAMYKNYFKITWRTMSRQKMYTGITVGGLALGLATCMIIFLYVRNELSYDKRYADGNHIYRFYNDYRGAQAERWTSTSPVVAQIFKTDYPEVEKVGRLVPQKWHQAGSNLFRREDRVENTYEEGFAYADNELLSILEIPFVEGNINALAKPNSIVISKRIAEKYFPNEEAMGKTVILNDDNARPYTIGGVMEDFAAHTHLHYDFFITLTNAEFWPGEQTSWCCFNYDTYVKLRPDADPAALTLKLQSLRDDHLLPYLQNNGDQSAADIKKNHFFGLQPVRDIYINTAGVSDELHHGDIRYVWLFSGIAVFILLLACINFVNLSTAKSANRAKEVGLRKVVGSVRGYLVRQFLTESVVYSLVSFALGVGMVTLALPFFNALAGKQLALPWTTLWFLPMLLMAALVVGIIAGLYPAFYLSGFKPVDVLKGSLSKGSRSSSLRGALVVFQFTTSIVLIVGTFVINKQMQFILNSKIGFDKEQVVIVQGTNTLGEQRETFKSEVLQLADVEHVTISSYLPVSGTNRGQTAFWKEGRSKEDVAVYAQEWSVDEDYIKTLGMNITMGRDFDTRASDATAIIINQAMAKDLGLPQPIGHRITKGQVYEVIGVVEDFNFESMKGQIRSLCFVLERGGAFASVKVKSSAMASVIPALNKVWQRFMPHQPFRYAFMDERYARMYADVDRTGKIFTCFAALAIVVACLGLFALSAFMVEQRGKEISIRLVMGASMKNIFRLLTQNVVGLVLISFVIAAPLSWFMAQQWLKDYTYKTPLSWDVFAIAGVLSVLIAMSTVSYHAIRAAMTNPANRLRSE